MSASPEQTWSAVGLMSGTSLDGVDVALIETDGEQVFSLGPLGYRPYSEPERAVLRQALADAAGLEDRTARPGTLAAAEALVTAAHAEAVEAFLAETGIARGAIDVIGFHGQTVLHRPERALTVQLGDGAALARRLGRPVVFDLRAADMAAGGQGAPLVPVFHRALARRTGLPLPIAVLNLGGVGNLTLVGEGEELVAFDTGPGNALLDDFVARRTGARFDEGGAIAAAGRVSDEVLARLLDHEYFARPWPKSLDRNDFSAAPVDGLPTKDGAATLVAFTVETVARGLDLMPRRPERIVVAGGGARNPAILRGLSARLPVPVVTADAIGWSADGLEAQAFALLAVRSRRGLPLTFPGTTGVARPTTGGVLAVP